MLYGKINGDGGGIMFEGRNVKGPSNIEMQFTQFCFICALGTVLFAPPPTKVGLCL